MAISTYTELQTAVDNWLARTDLAGRSPEFITMAEARMNRELETRSQEKRVTATLTADDAYVSLPTDLRRIRQVRLNTSPITTLIYYTPHAVDQKYSSTGTGKPVAYSVLGLEMYFRPTPDSGYTAEISYVADIDALDADTATNTILLRHPDAYLHGALAEAFGYLMDETRQAKHDTLFTRAITEIKADEERAIYGGGTLTVASDYGEIT
tara:strand:+ start:575 stop:1204 length:630 start_codon:yes stop_codon:yes gene_type:complete